ncbi:MAG TPA: hypothetical protein VGX21_24320 [Methylomirabilota bacterium]|jgi:hypothetical protein|nr:hypothetical protein [Methylomirabilota bacterium]
MRITARLVAWSVVALLATACASVPRGDTVPSAANTRLGGPPIGDPVLDTSPRSWGIDLFSGFPTQYGR